MYLRGGAGAGAALGKTPEAGGGCGTYCIGTVPAAPVGAANGVYFIEPAVKFMPIFGTMLDGCNGGGCEGIRVPLLLLLDAKKRKL